MTKRKAEGAEAPPHDLEAEKSVLGAILLHNDAYNSIASLLRAGDFWRDAHRKLYEAMAALLERKVAVDLVTLAAELDKGGQLTAVGGKAYITALVDGLPHSTNVEHYAGLVKETAVRRGIMAMSQQAAHDAAEGHEDATSILQRLDRAVIGLQRGHGNGAISAYRTSDRELMNDLEDRVAHRGQLSGVPTGFESVDRETFGWQAGEVAVIGARPSIGKSTLLHCSALAGAKTGPVVLFSLEMNRKQLHYRMLSTLSQVPLTRLQSGNLPGDYEGWPRLAAAHATLSALPIYIVDRTGLTVWDIRTFCRRVKAEVGLVLVGIDYVQLLSGTLDRRGASRNEELTDISRKIKTTLAEDLGVPVLVLSQLSRPNRIANDPTPKLSDLRESGALEQDADLVCFLHRKNHRESGITKFIIEKQRNGPTGSVRLMLDRETTTFTDGGEEPEPTAEQVTAATEQERQDAKTKAIIRQRAHRTS